MIAINRFQIKNILKFIGRRNVSTSPKKNETTAVIAETCKSESKVENWVSYGFDRKEKAEDRFWTHISFFTTITICSTLGTLYFAYMPDYSYKDWAQREAFLELSRREKKGLPLVDPNLVDINRIKLPTDEELGSTEIII